MAGGLRGTRSHWLVVVVIIKPLSFSLWAAIEKKNTIFDLGYFPPRKLEVFDGV